jgi:DNA ligase-1
MEIKMTKTEKTEAIRIFKVLYEIEAASGTNAKKEILAAHSKDKLFQWILKWFFNPYIVSGIGARKLDKECSGGTEIESLEALLRYLNVHNSGRDEDVATIQNFISNFEDEKYQTAIKYLVIKRWDKGLGIQATTVNDVWGVNFIPEFKVQLCQKFWDNPEYWEDKTFAISPKLDGYCVIAVKRNGAVRLFARSGKEYTGQFPEIEEELKNLPEDNIVLHGERMPLGFMKMDNKAQFKLAASGQKKGEKTGFCIAVYDYVPFKDWENHESKIPYGERYNTYMKMLDGYKYLFPLPNLYIGDDIGQVDKWFQWAVNNKKEGIIVKNMVAPYEWDRSPDCVKVKTIFDADLPIIGFEEGKGKLKNSLGAVLLDYKGYTIRCGSGFKEAERKEIWDNQKKYMGKIVEIVYMEESSDKNGKISLRHPIFKTFKSGE